MDASVGDLLAESLYVYDHGEFLVEAYVVERASGTIELSVHDAVHWARAESLDGYELAPADLPLVDAVVEAGLLGAPRD